MTRTCKKCRNFKSDFRIKIYRFYESDAATIYNEWVCLCIAYKVAFLYVKIMSINKRELYRTLEKLQLYFIICTRLPTWF